MSQLTRPLGNIEQYTSYRHNYKQYFAVLFAGVYLPVGIDSTSLKNSPFLKSDLYVPLAQLINEHQSLAVLIQNEDKLDVPHLFSLPSQVDIEKNIVYSPIVSSDGQDITSESLKASAIELSSVDSNPGLLKTMASRVSTQFESVDKILPWRVILTPVKLTHQDGSIIYGSHLIFAYHHSIADGTSGKIFMTRLLDILNTQYKSHSENSTPSSLVDIPPSSEIFPTIEHALDLPQSIFHLIGIKLKIGGWLTRFKPWSGYPVLDTISENAVGIEQYGCEVKLLRVSASKMMELLSKARKNKGSITSLFTGIGEVAFHSTLKEFFDSPDIPSDQRYPGPFYDGIQSSIPRNLRPNMKKGETGSKNLTFSPSLKDAMGVYVCSVKHDMPSSQIENILANASDKQAQEAAIWKCSNSAKKAILDSINQKNKNLDTGLLAYINSMPDFFRGKVGKPRNGSLEVSSILAGADPSVAIKSSDGTVLEPTAGTKDRPYVLKNLAFIQTASAIGTPVNLSLVSYKGGDLAISISWSPGAVPDGFVDKFEKQFIRLLGIILE